MESVSGKKCWKKAIVIKKTGKRSYKVRTEDGVVYSRNQRQIRVTRERMQNGTDGYQSQFETDQHFESQTESETDGY